MKNFDKYADLTGKRLTGEITPEEQRELSDWLEADGGNQSFASELEEAWELSGQAAEEPFEADMGTAWAKIDAALADGSAMQPVPSAKVVPMRRGWKRWSLAAAILALLAVGLWWTNGAGTEVPAYVEVRTGEDERKEINLPDGTAIALNENSLLNYAEKFAERNVTLVGEAFFNVKKMEDSPFTISSENATTTVLGTSFNVRAYPGEANVEVTVKTGTVSLAVETEENVERPAPVILGAGTAGVVKKAEAKVEKVKVDHANADAWRTMKLEFDDTAMKEVVSTLERYFGAEITLMDKTIFECPYTSEFDQPDLESILGIIGSTIGFEVEKNGETYLLKGGGCEPDN